MKFQKRILTVFAACLLTATFTACTAASTNTAANVSNRSVNAFSNGNAAPAHNAASH